MGKPRRPTDGRLKANRDFNAFMQRAVYVPSMRGDFKNDPTVRPPKPSFAERTAHITSLDDLSDSDLADLLRHKMIEEGIKPLSVADNMMAHLRERIDRRERQDGD